MENAVVGDYIQLTEQWWDFSQHLLTFAEGSIFRVVAFDASQENAVIVVGNSEVPLFTLQPNQYKKIETPENEENCSFDVELADVILDRVR